MTLLLLSAGWGTRLRPLTFLRPKALIPVMGKPCITACYDTLRAALPIESVCVNIHAMSPFFIRFLEKPYFKKWKVLREPEILGSGGSVMHCLSLIRSRWLVVMNSDTFLFPDTGAWLSQLSPERGAVILVVSSRPGLNNVVVDSAGRVVRFRSKELTREEKIRGYRLVAFAGIHLIDRNVMDAVAWDGKYADVIDLYSGLLDTGRVLTVECPPDSWQDIGTLQRYLNAHGRENRPFLWLGSETKTEADCILQNVVTWDGVIIKSGSRLTSCIVTDGAEVSGVFENAVITPSAVFPIDGPAR